MMRPKIYSANSCCGIEDKGLTFIDKTFIFSRFCENNWIFFLNVHTYNCIILPQTVLLENND